jgi:sulfite exporter TauE/SafE
MDLASINTPTAALLAGLVTSLHCAGMCGPLACMLGPARGEKVDATTVNTIYHVSRLAGYTTLGMIAGAVGMVPRAFFNEAVVRWLPWLLVVFFLLVALRLDHRLPRMVWLSRWSLRIQGKLRRAPSALSPPALLAGASGSHRGLRAPSWRLARWSCGALRPRFRLRLC